MSLDLSSLIILKDSNEMIDFICWVNHILRRVTNFSHPVIITLFKIKLSISREKKYKIVLNRATQNEDSS